MAVSDYTTLTASSTTAGSIREWVNRNDVPITTIFSDAEAWIYQRLRARQMVAYSTGALSTSAETIDTPTRYVHTLKFRIMPDSTQSVSTLELKTYPELLDLKTYTSTGGLNLARPNYFAVSSTNITFDTQPNLPYGYRIDYYQSLAALSTSSATNFLTDTYPSLLRAVCNFKSFEWMQNMEKTAYWKAISEDEIKKANDDADEALYGASLSMAIP